MKPLYLIMLAVLPVAAVGQSPAAIHTRVSDSARQSSGNWMDNLYAMGVETRNDSLVIREEVVRLFTDSAYRESVYPEVYTWPQALTLMQTMELKKAFWHLINLYESDTANRSYVLGTIMAYDSLMSMDKILLSTFYTYAFADPRVSRIRHNKPDIYRPDLLEAGLARLKEIIAHVWYYREKRAGEREPRSR